MRREEWQTRTNCIQTKIGQAIQKHTRIQLLCSHILSCEIFMANNNATASVTQTLGCGLS